MNNRTLSILLVGCGDIALRVAPLLASRYRLLGLVRRAERIPALRAVGITPVLCDLDDARSLCRIAGLADIVLHMAPPAAESLKGSGILSGVPGAADEGNCDLRTRRLIAALSRRHPPGKFVYISTSGVYGDCQGEYVQETHPLNPQTGRAKLRADAERQIRAWAGRNGVHASILRVPGIYSAERLPIARLRAGMTAIAAIEDGYTNHIHADDLARIVVAVLRRGRPNRVYHASDDSELRMGDYFDLVAAAFDLPRPPRLPRTDVERSVSPGLWSFMSESRRLTNARLKQELKVRLRYPTVSDALQLQQGGC